MESLFLSAILIFILLMIVNLVISFIYLRRQTVAAEDVRELEEQGFFLKLKSARDDLEKQKLNGKPHKWLEEQVHEISGRKVQIEDDSETVVESGLVLMMKTENGERLIMTPLQEKELKHRFKALVKSRGRLGGFAGEAGVLRLLKKGRSIGRAKLSYRNLLFDKEAGQVGEQLGIEWGEPEALSFFLAEGDAASS